MHSCWLFMQLVQLIMSIRQKLLAISSALDSAEIESLLLDVQERLPSKSQSSSTPMRGEQVEQLIQQSFIDECETFLKDNSRFHAFSRKIEKKADECLREIEKVERYSQIKTSVNLQMEVARVVERSIANTDRQGVLEVVCEYLQMPQALSDSLQQNEKTPDSESSFASAIEFIMKQRQLITEVSRSTNSAESPHLLSLLESTNNQLASMATSKALRQIKQLPYSSPALPAIRKYDCLFKLNEDNHRQFVEEYVGWRTECFRSAIWPKLMPLDYSLQQSLQDHCAEILEAVGDMLRKEEAMVRDIFTPEEGLAVLSRIWPVAASIAYSKLQRNFLKSIDLLALVTIKKLYHSHMELVGSVFAPLMAAFQAQPLPSSLQKLLVCIESQLKSESEKLTTNKYNIYSISSYLGIAEHLKMAHQCYTINKPYQNPELKTTGFITPFVDLATTREANQTNKSLVIFNINIWEIYREVWGKEQALEDGKGERMPDRCGRVTQKCTSIFIGMNMREAKSQFFPEEHTDPKKILNQLLTICSSDIKKPLHAELSLIIHPSIRASIKKQLNDNFMALYSRLVEVIGPMENEPLKKKCSDLDLNIKSLGKAADTVRIFSALEMQALLDN